MGISKLCPGTPRFVAINWNLTRIPESACPLLFRSLRPCVCRARFWAATDPKRSPVADVLLADEIEWDVVYGQHRGAYVSQQVKEMASSRDRFAASCRVNRVNDYQSEALIVDPLTDIFDVAGDRALDPVVADVLE